MAPGSRQGRWPMTYIALALVAVQACAATAPTCSTRGATGYALYKRGGQQSAAEAAAAPVSDRQCTTDAQCVAFRVESSGQRHGGSGSDAAAGSAGAIVKTRLGEYACIDGTCRYVVKAGELCFRAQDCAAYQLSRRWEQPAAVAADNTTTASGLRRRGNAELDGPWCAPDFCTLEATCGGAWTLPGAPEHAPSGANSSKPITNGTISCCRGFLPDAQCGLYSGSVDTCGTGYSCATPAGSAASMHKRTAAAEAAAAAAVDGPVDLLGAGTPLGKCASQEPHQQVWIGVILVLVGGATLNIGLNLQKYAFRKRQEKADADAAALAAPAIEAESALSPSNPSEVIFYSTDQLSKRRLNTGTGAAATVANLPTEPKRVSLSRGIPMSADDIRSCRGSRAAGLDAPIHMQQLHPCGESIAETAAAANMSRVSLASHHNPSTSPEAPAATRRRHWQALIQRRAVAKRLQNMPIGNSAWILGLVIFVLGNVINFVALQFAPQSLVAPLGAVSLVTNVIIAPLLNNEKIGLFDIGGIALIIAGCVIVVVFSGISQLNFRLCVLVQLLRAKPTVLFLCFISAAILAMYLFLWAVEKGVERHREEYHPLDADAGADRISPDGLRLDGSEPLKASRAACWNASEVAQARHHHHRDSSSSSGGGGNLVLDGQPARYLDPESIRSHAGDYSRSPALSEVRLTGHVQDVPPEYGHATTPEKKRAQRLGAWLRTAATFHPLHMLSKYVKPVRPDSRHVRYGLPLAYASLGSLMAALTTLFAKSLVNLLSVSLFDHDNQFTNFLSWAILLVTIFTAASQVYWINQGLLRYDALLQVPVFYVVWTVFDIIGGGIYFNEFRSFNTVKYVLFVVGVAVIFSGVGLLSHRLKNS